MTWLPVVGFEGRYEVSSEGQVRGIDRLTTNGRRWRGKVLKPVPVTDGYVQVRPSSGSRSKARFVHHLVLEAFVGPRPEGMVARHLNGDPGDNRVENLAWGTHSENAADRVAHGRDGNGTKTHCPQGHEYTEENTYLVVKRNLRHCRTCHRERQRERYQRSKRG